MLWRFLVLSVFPWKIVESFCVSISGKQPAMMSSLG